MRVVSFVLFITALEACVYAQSNFSFSNPEFERLLKGQFDPADFETRRIKPDVGLPGFLQQNIIPDSLSVWLERLVAFGNRNTVNDTVTELDKGIRGARKYISTQLSRWNDLQDHVILQSEFSFDYVMCNRTRHTQLVALIPGTGPQRDEMVIVEAHLDSRCEDRCDIGCLAEGAEDNGSGSALILELARILSGVQLNRSLMIAWVTGEEQSLGGSRSLATYCKNAGIKIKAVFNNDIVGGIECGKTSSPPSCPGPFTYDSIHFRIFSSGSTNSMHKNLARLSKLYFEHLLPVSTPTILDIMFAEDRTGRGSDHISFRELGYTSVRFTSSYEHGDGNPDQSGYEDRQHSSRDILGRDIDGDGKNDSIYVNFNYLAHNCFVNAVSAVNAANAVVSSPAVQVMQRGSVLHAEIMNPVNGAAGYWMGFRKITSAYFDTLVYSSSGIADVPGLTPTQWYVSACAEDSMHWLGMLGNETPVRITSGVEDRADSRAAIEILQNVPNPFDEQTLIPIIVHRTGTINYSELLITDIEGAVVRRLRLDLREGINEVLMDLPWDAGSGEYFYTLLVNGLKVRTLKMMARIN